MIDEVKPFLKFREVVEGDGTFNMASCYGHTLNVYFYSKLTRTGSFHGAKLLDREFEDYIKVYLGLQKWESLAKFQSRILDESWEYSIKPSFDNTDGEWIVDTIVDGKVNLNKKQIADCFEKSVMPGIKDLVNNQLELIKKETKNYPKVTGKGHGKRSSISLICVLVRLLSRRFR